MPPDEDPQEQRPLTAAESERVRRLLAEARHAEPMPADVVARLDRVIAGLADSSDSEPGRAPVAGPGPGSGGEAGTVVRLEHRRRKAGRLLLAAAAVVVVGVGVGQVVSDGVGGEAANDSAAGEAASEGLEAPDRDSGDRAGSDSQFDASEEEVPDAAAEPAPGQSLARLAPQRVRSDRFATDARRVRRAARDAGVALRSKQYAADATRCEPGRWGGGRYVRVSFDGDPGWLVYRQPQGETQVADLFLCGEGSAERSTTLPRR